MNTNQPQPNRISTNSINPDAIYTQKFQPVPTPPQPKVPIKLLTVAAGAAFGALCVGVFIGTTANMATTAKAPQTSAPITVTAEPQVITKAPESCLLAIDHANDLMDMYREVILISGDSIGYVLDGDVQGLDTNTNLLNGLKVEVDAALNNYNLAVAECQP